RFNITRSSSICQTSWSKLGSTRSRHYGSKWKT
ncbi:hypothetical protein TVAGG3_0245990, partial [Trichomonas vaginalis G3]